MISTWEWQLRLIRWDFFATLTWDDVELTTPSSRRNHVSRWILRWATHVCALQVRHIAWVTRWERGEAGDRPHCHLLIGRIPTRLINVHICFRIKEMWEHQYPCKCKNRSKGNFPQCSHGIAQIRLYDPTVNGESYMTKGRFSGEWAQGANAYELKKFNTDDCDALEINPRAWQEMLEARNGERRMLPVT